jgi:hypothetical protein
MKKFILALCVGLMTFMLGFTLTGCDNKGPVNHDVHVQDSAWFSKMYDQVIVNPVFKSPDEAVAFQMAESDLKMYKDIFLSLPEDILVDITNVCLKKYKEVTPNDIVKEYLRHKEYIDYTSDPPTQLQNNDSLADIIQEDADISDNSAMEERQTIVDNNVVNSNVKSQHYKQYKDGTK